MKNKIEDLRNHLFAQLERLNNPQLKGELLDTEIQKAASIVQVASSIIDSARVENEFLRIVGDPVGMESKFFLYPESTKELSEGAEKG